jgi:tRNA threonylcarbamoyladenosine modification (KEOPS) complex Cgi121 subunit
MVFVQIIRMIVEKFNIKDLELEYFIGITRIDFNLNKVLEFYNLANEIEALNYIFKLLENMQEKYDDTIIQIFNDKYILNQDHLVIAGYYTQKAFIYNNNVSKKKNIEFILYLAANRKIKNSMEAFGINPNDLKTGKLNFCIISRQNYLNDINNEVLQKFLAQEIDLTLNAQSIEKCDKIIKFFELSNYQIEVVLNSYGIKRIDKKKETTKNLDHLVLALFDLICEKMSLLSVEK